MQEEHFESSFLPRAAFSGMLPSSAPSLSLSKAQGCGEEGAAREGRGWPLAPCQNSPVGMLSFSKQQQNNMCTIAQREPKRHRRFIRARRTNTDFP